MLTLRCREGEGAEEVLETKVWGNVAYRRFCSGVLPARDPWWLQSKTNIKVSFGFFTNRNRLLDTVVERKAEVEDISRMLF